ncbi:MAG: hypothetical protein AABY22_21910 [Nanoarchaeota archaeon]
MAKLIWIILIIVSILSAAALDFFIISDSSESRFENCGIIDYSNNEDENDGFDENVAAYLKPAECLNRNVANCTNAKVQTLTEDTVIDFTIENKGKICTIGNVLTSLEDGRSGGTVCDYPKDVILSLSLSQLITFINSPFMSLSPSQIQKGKDIKVTVTNPKTGGNVEVTCRIVGDLVPGASGSGTSSRSSSASVRGEV